LSSAGSTSTQVGLFSTQISEQILRLRALSEGREGFSGQDLVALKRAIMATRLLGGSARILQFTELHSFLDRLLHWMQGIEERGKALSSTEQLILEGVIEVEERLMRSLEEDGDAAKDLTPYRDELADLLALMEKQEGRAKRSRPARKPKPKAPQDEDEPLSAALLLEQMGQLVLELESVDEFADDPTLSELCVEQLAELSRRLDSCVDRMGRALRDAQRAETTDDIEDWPRGDEILDPLWERVQERSKDMGLPVGFYVEGDSSLLESGLRDVMSEILRNLLDDTCNAIARALHEEEELVRVDIRLEIRSERGRVEVVLRDSAPVRERHDALTGGDALSFYRGVRRSRALVNQLNGILQVEPRKRTDVRFLLRVPSNLQAQTYQLLQLDDHWLAVPWVRVIESQATDGLVFEADDIGESFVRGGRSVPLLELGQHVHEVLPSSSGYERILLVGNVERRLGVYYDRIGDLVEAERLGDPPPGWEAAAYGSLEWDGRQVPILDVAALIEMRLHGALDGAGPGGGHDPMLDSYVPDPSEAKESGPKRIRVLLVNRSEFRRREIARVLQRQGHELSFSSELLAALKRKKKPAVDLVITDLRLGEEGTEDLSKVRQAYGGVPVILTSAAAREQANELAQRVGADGCWLDPYRPEDLQKLLDRVHG